jgi:hypothetical protein
VLQLEEWIIDGRLRPHLQLRQNSFSTTDSDLSSRLVLGIYDLAVVDDNGEAPGALAEGPANRFCKLGAGIGKEELQMKTC